MEVRFAQLLNENGVSVEQTTAKIKELVEAFNEAWGEYEEAVDNLENANEEDEEELKGIVGELEELLSEADAELCKKIQSWLKNKDSWEANAQRMAQGRANKSAQKGNTKTNSPQTSVDFGSTPTPNLNDKPISEMTQEKKSGSGFWWLAGFVAVVTLGAVVLKEK